MFENLLGWWMAQSQQRRQSVLALAGFVVVIGGFLLAVRSPVASLIDAGRPLNVRPGQIRPKAGSQAAPSEIDPTFVAEAASGTGTGAGVRAPAGPSAVPGAFSGAHTNTGTSLDTGTTLVAQGPGPSVEPTTVITAPETTVAVTTTLPSTTTAAPTTTTTTAPTTTSTTRPTTTTTTTLATSSTRTVTTPSTAPPPPTLAGPVA